ncbi:MAG: signal peptidase II [Bacteriovoracaceae bacterium]|jgi:lipoprotein signal peptidase|nr:signal peptidase II [Bacteriovoracaceae bacterium]
MLFSLKSKFLRARFAIYLPLLAAIHLINLIIIKFNFPYTLNPSFITGSFESAHPYLRISLLCLLGITSVIFLEFFSSTIAHNKYLKQTNFMISLMGSGILGNVLTRAIYHSSIDYIPIQISMQTFSFNFSDILIWSGIFYAFFCITFKPQRIWPDYNKRSFFNIKEQKKLIQYFLISSFITATLLIIVFSLLLRQIIHQYALNLNNDDLVLLLLIPLISIILTMLVTFIYSIYISKILLGPLKAFERFIERIEANPDQKLQLRQGDQLECLYQYSESIRTIVKSRKI